MNSHSRSTQGRSNLFLLCSIGVLSASLAVDASRLEAQEFPDFDLRVDCKQSIQATPGETVSFDATVVLATRNSPDGKGAQGWSLSLASNSVDIVAATIAGTVGDRVANGGLRNGGFEKTELTAGSGNTGVISALVLSFTEDITLPASGEEVILRIDAEVVAPAEGCMPASIRFQDGLQGAGQPVSNNITYNGDTRTDDGGIRQSAGGVPFDNDKDAYVHCEIQICTGKAGGFVRGDCDSNGAINLTDAIFGLNRLFQGGPVPSCQKACDTTDDGAFNITDPINLLNHLFLGGPAPGAPYPACGVDPTPDALSCAAQPSCA